ncbi:alpha-glucosidase/alpha-galactosidase [Coraliomargarita sp. SDUM461003]|uniref:Alpha-glucosidase/alpha-galactosidase n=1 Tax=Thalassobacterium maritimum TaxID=3041265 RepID=A0ABU1AZI5_9BACT|nr:alpha-glucosidase/alpha-galactosidase [Coraliomargarita sp. SDUM461003]MDQ8209532.1 alpha-glucosidase/alpha-galactosidase [Coraliomargarita sp. SDUM461003]
MSCKITLIGAGSVVFAKTLIGDILQFPELSDATICLMDIDADRLRVADVMMKRMAGKLGVNAKIVSTLDRREAIKGAKYVICTVQVGGYKPSTVVDFEIPKKYGLRQTIADTLGIGGIFRGLRTIPVLVGIAQEIEQLAHPDCLLLNYTNPMAMNCWAIDEAVGIPHVGLCHSVFGTARMLASHAKLRYDDVSYLVAGVNHMAFFLKFQYKGQDAYPLLFKVLNDPSRNYELVRYEMMRRLGYFVTESSEHQAEYVPYFIHFGDELVDRYKIPLDEYIRRCEAIMSSWKDTEAKLIGEHGDIEVKEQSHEYGSFIIHSRETNTPRTVYGNVPNRGIIDNLQDGCCVEVPCLVDGTGLNPVQIGELPPQLAAICMTNVNVQRLTVTAALSGQRESIYHAAMADPHTAATLPLDKIWAMCDELIEQHQKDGYLGDFAPVISGTGRAFAGVGDRLIVRAQASGAQLDTAGSELQLEIQVENPNTETRQVTLQIVPASAAIVFENTEVTIEVSPESTQSLKVNGRLQAPITESTTIDLETDAGGILLIGTRLIPRDHIEVKEDGYCHFEMSLSGFPCASGKMRRKGEQLELELEVQDSNPKPCLDRPRQGSFIQIFFSDPDGGPIMGLQLLPNVGKDCKLEVFGGNTLIAQNDYQYTQTKLNYSLKAHIPLADIRIAASGPFLMDARAFLESLGDAHSGGNASLSGEGESQRYNDRAFLLNC